MKNAIGPRQFQFLLDQFGKLRHYWAELSWTRDGDGKLDLRDWRIKGDPSQVPDRAGIPADTLNREIVETLCRKAGELLPGSGDPLNRWLDHLRQVSSTVDEKPIAGNLDKSKTKVVSESHLVVINKLAEASYAALIVLPTAPAARVTSSTSGAGGSKRGTKGSKTRKIDVAITLILRQPELTDAQIAKQAKCSKSYLSKNKDYQKNKRLVQRANAAQLKHAKYNARTGEMEAVDDG